MIDSIIKNNLFKIKREIKTHGTVYNIYKDILDEYGQPTGESEEVCKIEGLYHTTNGFVTRNSTYATTTHSQRQPMLLIQYKDADVYNIVPSLFLLINNKRYNIISVNDILAANIVCDLSLEVVENAEVRRE